MKKLFIILLVSAIVLPVSAMAAMYSYVDARGVTHYTNVPSDRRYKPKPVVKRVRSSRIVKGFSQGKSSSRTRYSKDYIHRHIQRAANYHRVDPMLIRAIIQTESNFNPRAVSSMGAQGLMQLMPGTASDLRVSDPFDVRQNINGGTRYFRKLLDSYHGNVELSLAAYNAGPGRVKPYGKIPQIPETVAYVKKVMRYYNSYKAKLPSLSSIKVQQMVTIN